MRILLVTQVVPYPPDSGPKIKTYNVLRYLAQSHEVHLVSFVRSEAEVEHARALAPHCSGISTVPLQRSRLRDLTYLARSLVTGRPFLIERDDLPAMRAAVQGLLARHQFDGAHADQLSMAQFVLDLPVPLRVLDEHNAVFSIVRRSAAGLPLSGRVLAALEWRKLRAYEGMLCRRFDHVTIVSDDDRRALEGASGQPFASTVVPIAVDTDALKFLPRSAEARHVLSLATMFYPPNVQGVLWFGKNVFPQVRQALPGTQFFVVGSRPPRSVTEFGKSDSGILVTGYVSDLEPLLEQSGVLVVPLMSGSGMRVKILEAFARGIPVVSTSIGVEGIDAKPGVHLLVGDNPADFADAVVRLLTDAHLATRLARAARALVESRYDWHTAQTGLDEVYPPGARLGPL